MNLVIEMGASNLIALSDFQLITNQEVGDYQANDA